MGSGMLEEEDFEEEEEKHREPVLEIDLDQVEKNCGQVVSSGEQSHDILCK